MADQGPSAPVVAAFDFDGTLTAYDTLLPFLVRLRGVRAVSTALAAGALGRPGSRDDFKCAVLARVLRGLDAGAVAAAGEQYAGHLLGRRVRPEMRRVVDWHRSQGHRLVLVSASLEVYLSRVGRELGFEAVLATRLEVDPEGRLTGRVAGSNVRGDEKARLLQAWLGDTRCYLHAYGDSASDRPMLVMAQRPVRARRGRVRADAGPVHGPR